MDEATRSALTDFLLARIEEDEYVALEAVSDRSWADVAWPSEVYDDGARNVAVALSPRRATAECDAKRALVGLAKEQPETFTEVLRWLALPYADHFAYSDDWRP